MPRRGLRAGGPPRPSRLRRSPCPRRRRSPRRRRRRSPARKAATLWTRPASSQTRQPSRRPGIAKNLVKDRATQSLRSTISVTLIPGTKSAKASSTTRTAPASTTRSATSSTSPRSSSSPVGLFGLQRNTTETPSRSSSAAWSPTRNLPRSRRATRRTVSMPEARAAAAYSEKVGSSTSALPPVPAALAARNSASAPPLVGTTISALTPR